MRIRYTVPAARSLERVLDHIVGLLPQGAKHVHERVQAIVTLLAQYPLCGPPHRPA